MLKTFNCGVGMTAVLSETEARRFEDVMNAEGIESFVLGEIRKGEGPPVQIA